MELTTYLVLNGQAEEAAQFYANVLGGKIKDLHRYESMPAMPDAPAIPENYKQKVLHCCIAFPGGTMSLADSMPGDTRNFGNGGHMLTLLCESVAQSEELYAKLCDGAQKIMCPLAEAFFAERYAEVVDRYGVLWAIYLGAH